ncbi:hypothetical protein [Algoriphagus sp.]|uniref:hypothetical protein n=1 Tax=Algoriphagus sp. TaxID=1872435 RepID=UPI0025E8F792|nr:hypothetical protein [Algoriphagus sp.]
MSVDFATKKKFILDLLTRIDGKFLIPLEIGKNYQEKFFLSREVVVVEPAKHLHKVFQALPKEGLIQNMGKGSDLRYGISKRMKNPITLNAGFIDYYIRNSSVPIEG